MILWYQLAVGKCLKGVVKNLEFIRKEILNDTRVPYNIKIIITFVLYLLIFETT